MSALISFQRLLEDAHPETLILISDDAQLINASKVSNCWHAHGETAWQSIDTAPRAQLAVIDAEASIPSAEAALIAGRLRDVYAERVVVIGPVDDTRAALNRQILTSLGFHQIGQSEETKTIRPWYQFDIENYKVTPDWLNPRYWANPELWDKFRW